MRAPSLKKKTNKKQPRKQEVVRVNLHVYLSDEDEPNRRSCLLLFERRYIMYVASSHRNWATRFRFIAFMNLYRTTSYLLVFPTSLSS